MVCNPPGFRHWGLDLRRVLGYHEQPHCQCICCKSYRGWSSTFRRRGMGPVAQYCRTTSRCFRGIFANEGMKGHFGRSMEGPPTIAVPGPVRSMKNSLHSAVSTSPCSQTHTAKASGLIHHVQGSHMMQNCQLYRPCLRPDLSSCHVFACLYRRANDVNSFLLVITLWAEPEHSNHRA